MVPGGHRITGVARQHGMLVQAEFRQEHVEALHAPDSAAGRHEGALEAFPQGCVADIERPGLPTRGALRCRPPQGRLVAGFVFGAMQERDAIPPARS